MPRQKAKTKAKRIPAACKGGVLIIAITFIWIMFMSGIGGGSIAKVAEVSNGGLRSPTLAAKCTETRGNAVCVKGHPPWSTSLTDLISDLEKFVQIYKIGFARFGSNAGGGSFFHYFALYQMVCALKPRHIVESGAYNGVGTWFLRQAAGPNVQIIVVTPNTPEYQDKEKDTKYFSGATFVDFNEIDWSFLDKTQTLLFMDDHQSEYRRIGEAYQRGFQHIAFDDNYVSILRIWYPVVALLFL